MTQRIEEELRYESSKPKESRAGLYATLAAGAVLTAGLIGFSTWVDYTNKRTDKLCRESEKAIEVLLEGASKALD